MNQIKMSSSNVEFDDINSNTINTTKDNNEAAQEAILFLDFNDFKNKYIENSLLHETENDCDNKSSKIDTEKQSLTTLIRKLETEFYFLEQENKGIYFSTEEMTKYSNRGDKDEDDDLNEYRAENLKLLFRNLERMKDIQTEILQIDSCHNIKNFNLLSMISCINKNDAAEAGEIDYKNPKNNPLIVEFVDRSSGHDINYSDKDNHQAELEFDKFDSFFDLDNQKKVVSTDHKQNEEIINEVDL